MRPAQSSCDGARVSGAEIACVIVGCGAAAILAVSAKGCVSSFLKVWKEDAKEARALLLCGPLTVKKGGTRPIKCEAGRKRGPELRARCFRIVMTGRVR